jgi:aminomethyltransferase
MAEGKLPPRFHTTDLNLGTGDALICGTGYTGEDGVEILVPPDEAAALWEELVVGGAAPAGLAARDTLRLEVNYCLYGNDLSEERNPIEAALGWAVKEETGFIGSEACAHTREQGPEELLVPFVIVGEGIPRQGNPILAGGAQVGAVTSGTHSPSLEVGIGMGYVRADLAEPGTELEIDVRGRRRAARVEKRPLYSKDG